MIETNNRVVFYGLTVQEELIYFQTGLVCACAAFFLRPFFFFYCFFLVRIHPCGTWKKKTKKQDNLGHTHGTYM